MLTTRESPPERLQTARALIGHIVREHHRYSVDAIARIRPLLSQALKAHGGDPGDTLQEIAHTFAHVAAELEPHQIREEQVLFPAILALEDGARATLPFPVSHPIARMTADHDGMRDLLQRMSTITGGYVAPADATPTWSALYRELAALDRDLQVHMHLENEVLFPRALAFASR